MQYFKHELFASHAFVESRRERAYRRTLRYGHARLARRSLQRDIAVDATADGEAGTVAQSTTLIALPRVQAVVDAVSAMSAASNNMASPRAA